MNVLFVTDNLPGADRLGRQLAGMMPGLHMEVSSDVDEAIRLSTVPGRFHAVLLDATLEQGDPLLLVTALRARKSPVAIVGLAPDADPGSIVSLMAAGVDDCVGKRAGFVDMLPGILRRACGDRQAPASDDPAPRVLYSGDAIEPIRPSAPPQSHPSRIRRGMTAGAASFLLRDLLDSLPSGDEIAGEMLPGNPVVAGERSSLLHGRTSGPRIPEAGFPEAPAAPEENAALEQHPPAPRPRADGERAFPEDPCGSTAERLRVTEEERLLLLESVRDLQAQLARQAEEFQSARRQWELWRAALQKRLAEVETIALRIEDARQELERRRPDAPEGTHNR